jgi:Pyruvate/2-oxoacid:ferredoxin oxidoreductase delta subunit
MRKAGLKQVADEIGIELADFDNGKVVVRDEAMMNKRFIVANGVLDADGLISLPKLKTHEFTVYTGAIKNQYGCIPGVLKSQQHARFRSPQDFAHMLVDLNMVIRPRLYIMDAIMAMEGNGPMSGSPRKLGVLLFSSDPLALDSVACRLINLDYSLVPTFEPGEKAGLGTYHENNIEIVGGNIGDFVCDDFKVMRKRQVITPDTETGKGVKAAVRRWGSSFVKKKICQRPAIDKAKCTVCGTCVRYCPVVPKAVNWYRGKESRPPVHDYNLCIRCFCCQEYCPEGAISVSEPLLGRFLFWLYGVVMR